MSDETVDAPYSDEYNFHRCPVEGCGASILCTGQTQGACDARIAASVAEDEATEQPPRGCHAPELLARGLEPVTWL
jgi:hypothetical protein